MEEFLKILNGDEIKSLSLFPLPYAMAPHSSTLAWKIPWTIACQAPLSMGFSRQEYWSALPCPSPGDFPDPGIEYGSPALVAQRVKSLPASAGDVRNVDGSLHQEDPLEEGMATHSSILA